MTSPSTDRRYGLSSGTALKAPCKAATTAAITLSGEQTIDGVSCVTGDRVLVKNQASSIYNGIYVVDTGTWTRDVDADSNRDFVNGTVVFVRLGSANGNTSWMCTTVDPIVLGTSAMTFVAIIAPAIISSDSSTISFLQAGAGATTRTVQSKERDIVSVKDFGATGDGTTVDYTAFVNALASLTNGGIVYVPPGNYNLGTNMLTINTGYSLVGAGATRSELYTAPTNIKSSNATATIMMKYGQYQRVSDMNITNSSTGAGLIIRDCWNCVAENLQINSAANVGGASSTAGVHVDTVDNTYLSQHCRLVNVRGNSQMLTVQGIDASHAVTCFIAENCYFQTYNCAFAIGSFINCTAERDGTASNGYIFNDSFLTIISPDIEGAYNYGIDAYSNDTFVLINPNWGGWTGTQKVNGTGGYTSWGGGVGTVVYLAGAGSLGGLTASSESYSNFASLSPIADSIAGGAQTAHWEWWGARANAQTQFGGVGDAVAEWWVGANANRRSQVVQHSVAVGNTTTTILTIDMSAGGARATIEIDWQGNETGAGNFSVNNKCVVANNAGTLSKAAGTPLASGTGTPVLSFTISGTNLLVQLATANATPAQQYVVASIRGSGVGTITKA